MQKIIAIVGMPGSGKTEVARYLEKKGFSYLRFGQIVIDEVLKRGTINETTEREIRNGIRKKYGAGGVAILNIPRLDELLIKNNVIVDGLYSWEEFKILKERYSEKDLTIVAICAGAEIRYSRLANRPQRPLTHDEARSRDFDQIEQANQGGPIAMADRYILNESSKEALYRAVDKMLS